MGDNYWIVFHMISLDESFLNSPVTQSEANDADQHGKVIVDNVHVAIDFDECRLKKGKNCYRVICHVQRKVSTDHFFCLQVSLDWLCNILTFG